MAPLTPVQRLFLERYILGGRSIEDVLDLADGPPEGRATGLASQAREIRRAMEGLAIPPGANQQERGAMIAVINRINEGLSESLAPVMVAEAGRGVLELERLHTAHTDRLDEEARARGVRAQQIRQEIGNLTVENGDPDAIVAIGLLATALTDGWTDPPTVGQMSKAETDLLALKEAVALEKIARDAREEKRKELLGKITDMKAENADDAEGLLIESAKTKAREALPAFPGIKALADAATPFGDLEKLIQRTVEAVKARQEKRADLLNKIEVMTAEDADEAEVLFFNAAKDKARLALPENPGAKVLEDAAIPYGALETLIKKIGEDVAARGKRRDEIVIAKAVAAPKGLIKSERDRIDLVLSGFPILGGAISAANLILAETALEKLKLLHQELSLIGKARAEAGARVATAVAEAVWDKGDLAVPAGAPAAIINPVKLKLDALNKDNAAYAKPEAPDDWSETDPAKLGLHADEVIKAIAAIAMELADIKQTVQNIADAKKAATDQIAATNLHTLSGKQQKTLTDLIPAAEGKFATLLSEAGVAVQALKDIQAKANTLQRDLRAMALRIKAVDLKPAGASKAEEKVLADLHKAAVDALAEVEP